MEANFLRSWLPLVMAGQFLSVAALVKNSSGQQITTMLAIFFIEMGNMNGTMVLLKAEWFPLRNRRFIWEDFHCYSCFCKDEHLQ